MQIAICNNIPGNIGDFVSNEVSYEGYSRIENGNEFPMCKGGVDIARFIAIIENGRIVSTKKLDEEIIISKQIQPFLQ